MPHAGPKTGYAKVNGLDLYYERHGEGAPLLLLHGGFGLTGMWGPLLPSLAEKRQVIAVDLQGHGRTADIDRPLRSDLMAEDIAALIHHLGLARADVMGYSMGGSVALRMAIQHPELVDRLVLMSIPFRREGWYPEVRQNMAQMGPAIAELLMRSPLYQAYAAVAPQPEHFPALVGKMGELLRQEYDWSREVSELKPPVLLIYGDHDSISPSHMAEFFGRLGGGQKDAGWDGSGMSRARLAILPGRTHYDLSMCPLVPQVVSSFLDSRAPGAA